MPAAACCCLRLPAAACCLRLPAACCWCCCWWLLLLWCCNQTASKARNNCCCCCAHKETRVKGIIPWRAPPCVCRGRRISGGSKSRLVVLLLRRCFNCIKPKKNDMWFLATTHARCSFQNMAPEDMTCFQRSGVPG